MLRRLVLWMVVVGLLAVPVVAQPAFIIVQDAQTTGDGTAIDRRGSPTFTFFVEWSAGTSAGVITIEEAADATYTGTWSSLATVTWAVADSTEAVHLGPAPYGAIRARISTTVTGGTVTVRVRGIQ